MSAILTVNQLAKQGIPKDKIKLSSIQYGDNDEKIKRQLSASKGQMVALVDFARLPNKGERIPDFWSDHHIQDEKSKKIDYEKQQKSKGIPSTKVSKGISFERQGRKHGGETSYIKTKEKKFRLPPNERRDMNMQGVEKGYTKELFDKYTKKSFNDVAKDKKNWSGISLDVGNVLTHWKKPDITYIMSKVRTTKIDPTGKKKILDYIRRNMKSRKINESIGKTEYPSEAAHLAKVHAQNLMTGRDIEAISKIDSANYTNLTDVLDLPKNFKNKGRMERLAILTNVIMPAIISGNPTALHKIILNSSPSLVSVYNNLLKIKKLNNRQYEAVKEIVKENPDWNKINKLRTELPKEMAKDVVKGKRLRKLSTIDSVREKRQKDIEKHTDPKTTKFKKGNDFIIVQSAAGKGQPQRFLSSILTKQSGERYPVAMREWATMIQVSLNPDLDPEDAKKFNLTEKLDKVLKSILNDVNRGKIKVKDKGMTNWALKKVIIPEAGGHAGIATAGGLGTLGLAPKSVRLEIKKLQQYERRVKALKGKKNMKDIMPKSAKELNRLKNIKAGFVEERKAIIEEIKKRLLDGIEREMKEKGVKPIKGEERFKVKRRNGIKEDIQWISKTMKV